LSDPDAAAEGAPKPRSARSRSARVKAQRRRADRNFRIFNMLKAGVPMAEIARQEGLSPRRARSMVQELLESRQIDPAPGFVQTQIGRLSDAMMIAHTMMMSGNLQALDRVVRLIHELERYHGFGRAEVLSPIRGPQALASDAAPRALPPPEDAAKIDTASA
jgi:hypothetical protein